MATLNSPQPPASSNTMTNNQVFDALYFNPQSFQVQTLPAGVFNALNLPAPQYSFGGLPSLNDALASPASAPSGYSYNSVMSASTEASSMTEPYTPEAIKAKALEFCKEVGKIQRLFEDATQDDAENGGKNGFRLDTGKMHEVYKSSEQLLRKPELPYEIRAMLNYYMAYGHYIDEVALAYLQRSLDALDSLDNSDNRNPEFTQKWRDITMRQIEYHSTPDTHDPLPEDLGTSGFFQIPPETYERVWAGADPDEVDIQTCNRTTQAAVTTEGSNSLAPTELEREQERLISEFVAELTIEDEGGDVQTGLRG